MAQSSPAKGATTQVQWNQSELDGEVRVHEDAQQGMRLFIDEGLDPEITKVALAAGYEATSSRDLSRLSVKDWNRARYVVEHDYVP